MGVHLPSKHASQRASLRASLVLLAGAVGVAVSVAPSGAAPSHPERGLPRATAAKTMPLSLNASMHLIGRPGHVLNEQGSFTGTLSGSIAIHFVSATSTSGTGTFVAYPQGGSISGRTATRGHVVGANVYFSGTMSITSGTGRWAHAAGSGLQFNGVINRQNFHATGHMQGSIGV
jgi:hypothetical protein